MTQANVPPIIIRDINTIAEVRRVEQLQQETWGGPELDVVPLSQLVAARESGGVLIGAFLEDRMVGFAYGFVGLERGKLVHHSHMLAVLPDFRSHNLGFRLKMAQRERVLGQGIELMSWTFDPLQSRNAYFNFNKLGVISDRYLIDFYGVSASFLHRSGTDRLWVTWHLTSDRSNHAEASQQTSLPPNAPLLVGISESGEPETVRFDSLFDGDTALIQIPADIGAIEKNTPEIASEWRRATQSAFLAAIDAGFYVADFYRGTESMPKGGAYLLKRRQKAA